VGRHGSLFLQGIYCHHEKDLVVSLRSDTEEMDAEGEVPLFTLDIEGVIPSWIPHIGKS
jgi:hypothetical protein